MGNNRIGRPAKSVYKMSTKQYMSWLSRNRISKEWIIDLLKNETYLSFSKDDEKLTLKELIEKYGNELKDMICECCIEL